MTRLRGIASHVSFLGWRDLSGPAINGLGEAITNGGYRTVTMSEYAGTGVTAE